MKQVSKINEKTVQSLISKGAQSFRFLADC